MNYNQVLTQINTLPSTYTRTGPLFGNLMSSFAYGVSRYTESVDYMMNSNQSISTMSVMWLNFIGTFVNVPRNNNTTTAQYQNQIQSVIAEPQGTPVAILKYLNNNNILATYSDNFSGPGDFSKIGWSVSLETPYKSVSQLALSLARVRPAGVPFTINTLSGGLYVNTINFIGNIGTTGQYLSSPFTNQTFTIPATTNNIRINIPTRFLTDTTLNNL